MPLKVSFSSSCFDGCVIHAHWTAHSDAGTKASVTHRDVSVGNILIVRKQDGSAFGCLIDWELAKYGDDSDARVYEKTVLIVLSLRFHSSVFLRRVLTSSWLLDYATKYL